MKSPEETLDEINPIRWNLIKKKYISGLSEAEEEQLQKLQEQATKLVDQIAPLNTEYLDKLEQLLKKLEGES